MRGGYDLKLLELEESAVEGTSAEVAAMHRNKTVGTIVTQVGLGFTEFGKWQNKLRGYNTSVTTDDECIGDFWNESHDYQDSVALCQGQYGAPQRTGMTDSGGPSYVYNENTQKYDIAGLVSGGVAIKEDGWPLDECCKDSPEDCCEHPQTGCVWDKPGIVRMTYPGSEAACAWISSIVGEDLCSAAGSPKGGRK